MTRTSRPGSRTAAGMLAGTLLLFPLAACSDATVDDRGAGPTTGAPADEEEATESATEDAGSPAAIDCAGVSCELTLASGQEADVLGTDVSFTSVEGDAATIRVGDDDVSCRQGEEVSAGPLTLECTTVTEDSVTLTARLG
jgi:hypothetical protein